MKKNNRDLDKSLTRNYKKVDFTETGQPLESIKPTPEPPAAKKPRKAAPKKKATPKPVRAKVEKPIGRKPGPSKKKIAEKPKKKVVDKAKKAPIRKPASGKPRLIGRKTDLLKMGEGAFLYSLELTRRVEEMEREIADYQRVFEVIREIFSREMDEIEEWLGVVLK
jgi:hypothetical protein